VRVYLLMPALDHASTSVEDVEAVLDPRNVAAVLVRLASGGEGRLEQNIKTIAPIIQRRDIALLTDGPPELAARTAADGAHCCGLDALTSALRILNPKRIVGAGCMNSRHDSMLAGEAGADYLMFGEPDAAGRRPGFEAVLERVGWWAELFEVPCVAYAAGLDEVAALARAGADFIAAGDLIWRCPAGPAAGLSAVVSRLRGMEMVK
jgi:thiamine-phosphate pyrophosphorylase